MSIRPCRVIALAQSHSEYPLLSRAEGQYGNGTGMPISFGSTYPVTYAFLPKSAASVNLRESPTGPSDERPKGINFPPIEPDKQRHLVSQISRIGGYGGTRPGSPFPLSSGQSQGRSQKVTGTGSGLWKQQLNFLTLNDKTSKPGGGRHPGRDHSRPSESHLRSTSFPSNTSPPPSGQTFSG